MCLLPGTQELLLVLLEELPMSSVVLVLHTLHCSNMHSWLTDILLLRSSASLLSA